MATLSAKQRNRLPRSAFAWPEREKLPIGDEGHVRRSLGRFAQTSFPDMATSRAVARRILRAAKKLGISVSSQSAVSRVAAQLKKQPKAPAAPSRRRVRKSNPDPARSRERAMEISREFHGSADQVIELSEKERRLPRFVVALGKLPELTYEPDPASKRGAKRYSHKSGDRGLAEPVSRARPILAADPATGRPLIVQGESPMKLDPRRGLVG